MNQANVKFPKKVLLIANVGTNVWKILHAPKLAEVTVPVRMNKGCMLVIIIIMTIN